MSPLDLIAHPTTKHLHTNIPRVLRIEKRKKLNHENEDEDELPLDIQFLVVYPGLLYCQVRRSRKGRELKI